jgi:hypothetical protein
LEDGDDPDWLPPPSVSPPVSLPVSTPIVASSVVASPAGPIGAFAVWAILGQAAQCPVYVVAGAFDCSREGHAVTPDRVVKDAAKIRFDVVRFDAFFPEGPIVMGRLIGPLADGRTGDGLRVAAHCPCEPPSRAAAGNRLGLL